MKCGRFVALGSALAIGMTSTGCGGSSVEALRPSESAKLPNPIPCLISEWPVESVMRLGEIQLLIAYPKTETAQQIGAVVTHRSNVLITLTFGEPLQTHPAQIQTKEGVAALLSPSCMDTARTSYELTPSNTEAFPDNMITISPGFDGVKITPVPTTSANAPAKH